MIHLPVLRWGEPYRSLEVEPVVHFATGETLAEVSQANAGLIRRDLRTTDRGRKSLRAIEPEDLLGRLIQAANLFLEAELPCGDGVQTPQDFVTCQSASTGLPEHMCRFNMGKLHHVLRNMEQILAALTRNLDLSVLTRGYGLEGSIMRSYQAMGTALGVVLPSNSPGVHGLWLPVPALQVGLVLKPGPQEPWTPYRMAQAFQAAGIPSESICIYPGGPEAGAAVLEATPRTLIFGSKQTVDTYRGDPSVQVHGPGFSKILFGDDQVDNWERHIDLMVDSVLVNSGRSCISCSGIWVSRHGREIAEALAQRLGPVAPRPPQDPESPLAAFTVPAQAEGINAGIEAGLKENGVEEVSARHRNGDRLIMQERCAYLQPTVVACDSPDRTLANTEYMFPFVSVVQCPQQQMPTAIDQTLVATVISEDAAFRQELLDSTLIDRLNLGPIPTIKLDWLQPHEGSLIDFLFRARAFQVA